MDGLTLGTVLASVFGGAFLLVLWPAWPLRGIMLRFLLKTYRVTSISGYTVTHSIQGGLRWNVWPFTKMELDCLLETRALCGGAETYSRTPERGGCATVSAGQFEWPVTSKSRGEHRVFFFPPKYSGIGPELQRASGAAYLVRVSLSWCGIPVYSQRFIVDCYGVDIDEAGFSMHEHP